MWSRSYSKHPLSTNFVIPKLNPWGSSKHQKRSTITRMPSNEYTAAGALFSNTRWLLTSSTNSIPPYCLFLRSMRIAAAGAVEIKISGPGNAAIAYSKSWYSSVRAPSPTNVVRNCCRRRSPLDWTIEPITTIIPLPMRPILQARSDWPDFWDYAIGDCSSDGGNNISSSAPSFLSFVRWSGLYRTLIADHGTQLLV